MFEPLNPESIRIADCVPASIDGRAAVEWPGTVEALSGAVLSFVVTAEENTNPLQPATWAADFTPGTLDAAGLTAAGRRRAVEALTGLVRRRINRLLLEALTPRVTVENGGYIEAVFPTGHYVTVDAGYLVLYPHAGAQWDEYTAAAVNVRTGADVKEQISAGRGTPYYLICAIADFVDDNPDLF